MENNNLKLYKVKVNYTFVILTDRKNDYELIEHLNEEITNEIMELGKFKIMEIKNKKDIPIHYIKQKPLSWYNSLISNKTTEEIFNRLTLFEVKGK